MEMKFSDYINNPMGKDNAVISNREMYRQFYSSKFNALMLRENGKIDYHLYKYKEEYVCHIKIPSETVKDFYYDVVVYFYQHDKKLLASKSLEDYYVKFYSNDPAFVFTFAHAFSKNNLFLTDLSSKMSNQALKQKADQKNPKDEVGYVKSLYFAYLFMKNKGLFSKIHYVAADKYSPKELSKNIMNADEKIKLRMEEEEKQKKKKVKTTNNRGSNTDNSSKATNGDSLLVKTTKRVGSIMNTKNAKTVKNVKTTKRK